MKKLLLILAILPFMISCHGKENKGAAIITVLQPANTETELNKDSFVVDNVEMIVDSVFENVIEIGKNNIVNSGTDYLFDISIPKSKEAPVLFISAEIPPNLLPTIYPEFQKLTIITPNRTAYKKDTGYSALEKRAPSFVIYKFNRAPGTLIKDSLIITHFPKMKFAKKKNLKNNERAFFYSEGYGSFCCPKDLQYENKPTREEFIKYFEKRNNVKITNIYRKNYGKEGEHGFYYPLEKLPNTLKLKFIQEREFSRIINRNKKYILKTPIIYTPFILEINDRMEKI